ncbi:type VII toxin-antitoxin system MntA family adenylyltransferase antitoxin [Methanoregula sp.]|uniref:type VII toxin-antitoxin system MntA family adenylyltransferase antitoxin n=1 Tax=Methanoregula sp. TaxID=2052170 RepID=UPI003BB0055E
MTASAAERVVGLTRPVGKSLLMPYPVPFPKYLKTYKNAHPWYGVHVIVMSVSGKNKKAPDKEALGSVLEELRTKDSILAIILFGSVARGQARPISDIDLSIITGGDVPASEQIDLLSYGSDQIDVSLFRDLPLTIRFRVIKEGVTLFCRDPLALHRIKVATVREYLDTAPLIRKYCLHALGIAG